MNLKRCLHSVPRPLRGALVVSTALVAISAILAMILGNFRLGIETAITGGFSVALLCVYVVYYGNIMAGVEDAVKKNPKDDAPSAAVSKIMLLSFARLIVFAALLCVCVAVFDFSIYAAVIGVSAVYLPMLLAPLFSQDKQNSNTSEEVDVQRGDG